MASMNCNSLIKNISIIFLPFYFFTFLPFHQLTSDATGFGIGSNISVVAGVLVEGGALHSLSDDVAHLEESTFVLEETTVHNLVGGIHDARHVSPLVGKMDYSWLASKQTALIRMANVLYKDRFNGNTQLNWDYSDFDLVGKTLFPKKHGITLTTPKKEVKLGMTLNYIGNESEWETRTEVSNKYREVTVDEILRRLFQYIVSSSFSIIIRSAVRCR